MNTSPPNRRWQVERSDLLLDTPYLRLRRDTARLPDGRVVPDYYVVEAHPIVVVFALTTTDEVLLVEQYKHGWGDVLLELPAGLCDGHADLLAEAQRELLEETGYAAPNWERLGAFISNPTRANNEVHLFMARGAHVVAAQALDPNEDILVRRAPLGGIRAYVADGRVRVLDSVLAIERGLARLGL